MMGRDLAQRAAAVQEQAANGGQLNPRQQLEAKIEFNQATFALAMPKGTEAVQLVRDAITAVRLNPKLAECDPASVLGSLMTCAQLGLRPGVLGQAWVLPFWSSKDRGHRAQLIIGYQGYVELAHRTGKVASIIARDVKDKDYIDVDYGVDEQIVHKPLIRGERGETVGYYCVVKYVNGGKSVLYATKEEIEAHRDRFATAKTKEGKIFGPWVDHFDAMARKTVIRELATFMPKSTEFAPVAAALAADNSVRKDFDPRADVAQASQWVDEPPRVQIDPGGQDAEPYDGEADNAARILAEKQQ